MRTLLLCGGLGTRSYPDTAELPKPLLPVGGVPLLRHVMDIFASQGHDDFVLAAGYRADAVAAFAAGLSTGWQVDVVDTGETTPTGERVQRCRSVLGEEFFCTYGDGVADVDLDALLRAHRDGGRAATVTTVPLPSPYGVLDVAGSGEVTGFREKPALRDHPINAGFMVLSSAALDGWPGPDLERDALPALAGRGSLTAYRHEGFWASVDTYKDRVRLDQLCEGSSVPWLPARSRV